MLPRAPDGRGEWGMEEDVPGWKRMGRRCGKEKEKGKTRSIHFIAWWESSHRGLLKVDTDN